AWKLYEKDMHLELVDPTLDPEEYSSEEVKRIIEIALLCTQASPSTRPTMSEVVLLLKSKNLLMENMMRPTMPVFVHSSNVRSQHDTSTSTASSSVSASKATVSTSVLSAR
ncbi:hypothetical protein HN873_000636, partial [Arachis hypogaea]